VSEVKGLLTSCCPSSADDPDEVLIALSPDDQHEAAPNRPDRNESILGDRMLLVVNLEVVDFRSKKLGGFVKTDSMLSLVREVLASSHATFTDRV
jgi:hypothetical protein